MHRSMLCRLILPDFSKFIDFSSLFVALAGLLFATWQPHFQELLSTPRPPLYLNRKAYIHALQGSIVAKALPLSGFLLAYVVSLSGVATIVFLESHFTLRPTRMEPAATLFMLTYWLALFLFVLSVSTLERLTVAWWRAGSDRGSAPRLTRLR
jgi:hypothetical protein